MLHNGVDALRRRGRGYQKNWTQTVLFHGLAVIPRLFRRQIQNQNPIDASFGTILDESLKAVAMKEVEINKENNGDLRLLPDIAYGLQHLCRRRPRVNPTLSSQLVNQSISERVTERDPKLKNIGTRFFQS